MNTIYATLIMISAVSALYMWQRGYVQSISGFAAATSGTARALFSLAIALAVGSFSGLLLSLDDGTTRACLIAAITIGSGYMLAACGIIRKVALVSLLAILVAPAIAQTDVRSIRVPSEVTATVGMPKEVTLQCFNANGYEIKPCGVEPRFLIQSTTNGCDARLVSTEKVGTYTINCPNSGVVRGRVTAFARFDSPEPLPFVPLTITFEEPRMEVMLASPELYTQVGEPAEVKLRCLHGGQEAKCEIPHPTFNVKEQPDGCRFAVVRKAEDVYDVSCQTAGKVVVEVTIMGGKIPIIGGNMVTINYFEPGMRGKR